MLAVNGSTFDGLVRAGFTPGQVDDALARLGKRVHRTSIGWESRKIGGLVDFAIACYPGPGGIRTRWRSDLPLPEQVQQLIHAGCIISGRSIFDRPGYPSITKRQTPYRLVAFSPVEVDMTSLGFEPEVTTVDLFVVPADASSIVDKNEQWASTEVIIPADPTIFTTATAAGNTDRTDRTDRIITANTLLRADTRNDDDTAALEAIRNRLQFLADTGYDLRWNLPS
jgi:hypothetical protein